MGTTSVGSVWQAGLSRHLAERLRTATAEQSQRRRVASVLAVGVAAMLGYHAFFGMHGVVSYQGKRTEHHTLNRQITELQQENNRLKLHVDHLKSDPRAIEYEALKRLRYTRPGQVIVLNEDKPPQQETRAERR